MNYFCELIKIVNRLKREPSPRPCKSIGKSITKPLYLENIKDHRINKKYKKIRRCVK